MVQPVAQPLEQLGAKGFSPSSVQSVMGFDYGRRRIGVSVGQSITGTATALAVVQCQQEYPMAQLQAVINEWRPQLLLVGLPLLTDGSWQEMASEALGLARKLAKTTQRPVLMVDERHSSQQADEIFKQMRQAGNVKRKDAKQQDSVAARIIVERWLQGVAPGIDLAAAAALRVQP